MADLFSRRYALRPKTEITVRDDAPESLRFGLIQVMEEIGLNYVGMREIICRALHVFPNPNNWTEIPNVREEVVGLIQTCAWYQIYDILEVAYRHFGAGDQGKYFTGRINEILVEQGIGWHLVDGQVTTRGGEEFERVVELAGTRLGEARLMNAKSELDEALRDLSRRPDPDVTGTIQHCIAALECVARTVSGDDNATLGELMRRHGRELGITSPLDSAIERMWGYASEVARHVRENRIPSRDEAELLLGVSASLVAFLTARRLRQ